jgi:hypothetical protein
MLSTQIWIPWTEVTVERMFFLGSVQLPAFGFWKASNNSFSVGSHSLGTTGG